ncbi:hypothetical protein DENSPDRAFT_261981 [Dentipellis sp. KUC8613]|nr:hypothetical protein DENSPDRAFT_261981 [Dentipellis sp. KUC8613]
MSFGDGYSDPALRRIQRQPAQVIQEARDGDLVSLNDISHYLPIAPQLQTQEVLIMVLSHLTESKLQEAIGNTSLECIYLLTKRADIAMIALGAFSFIGPQDSFPESLLSDSWPGIFQWANILVESHVKEGTDEGQNTLEMIASALYFLALYGVAFQSMMSATPGMVELATHLWLSEEFSSNPERTQSPFPYCSTVFYAILDKADSTALNVVLRTAGGGAHDIAHTALRRLRSTIANPTPSFPIRAQMQISVLFEMTRRDRPSFDLRRAISSNDGTKLAVLALRCFLTVPLSEVTTPAVRMAFKYLSNLLDADEGVTNVRVAIEEGMLGALIDISSSLHLLGEDVRGLIATIVGVTVPSHLIYHSVLCAFESKIPQFEVLEGLARDHRSPIRDSWYQMREFAMKRFMMRLKFDRSPDAMGPQITTCDQCQRSASKDAFRRCSGCHVTYYCAKECQLAAWKTKHRAECKRKKEECAKKAVKRKDRLFISHIVVHDICHNSPTLEKLAARNLPGMPLSQVGFSVDYTCVPERYGVVDLSSGSEPPGYVNCFIPSGEKCMQFRMIAKKSLWTEGRKLWGAGGMPNLEATLNRSSETYTIVDGVDINIERPVFYELIEEPEEPTAE